MTRKTRCAAAPAKMHLVAQGLCFADNRAIVHLHGGISPWISDGTPHQWITPAGENTDLPAGHQRATRAGHDAMTPAIPPTAR